MLKQVLVKVVATEAVWRERNGIYRQGGLVCDEKGLPPAVEVWPGDATDKDTVIEQIDR